MSISVDCTTYNEEGRRLCNSFDGPIGYFNVNAVSKPIWVLLKLSFAFEIYLSNLNPLPPVDRGATFLDASYDFLLTTSLLSCGPYGLNPSSLSLAFILFLRLIIYLVLSLQ